MNLGMVVVTVCPITTIADGNGRSPVSGRGVLVMVPILEVVLLLTDVMTAEEIAPRRYIITLTVLLARWKLWIDNYTGGDMLGLLVT